MVYGYFWPSQYWFGVINVLYSNLIVFICKILHSFRLRDF